MKYILTGAILCVILATGCGKWAPEIKTTHRVEAEIRVIAGLELSVVCGKASEEEQTECIKAVAGANEWVNKANKKAEEALDGIEQ